MSDYLEIYYNEFDSLSELNDYLDNSNGYKIISLNFDYKRGKHCLYFSF